MNKVVVDTNVLFNSLLSRHIDLTANEIESINSLQDKRTIPVIPLPVATELDLLVNKVLGRKYRVLGQEATRDLVKLGNTYIDKLHSTYGFYNASTKEISDAMEMRKTTANTREYKSLSLTDLLIVSICKSMNIPALSGDAQIQTLIRKTNKAH